MDFSLNEEQTIIRDTTRKFLQQECPPDLIREMIADEKGHSPELWRKMAELGWMGLAFEERYGGFGGTFLDLAIILEEMGRVLVPGPFFATVILGGMTIADAASDALKERLLPGIADGSTIMTAALTERDGSYTSEAIETTAEPTEDGWLISGTKCFVPDALVADAIICPAKGPAGECSLFVVDTAAAGIKTIPLKILNQQKQAEVILSGVTVPSDSLVGEAGDGWSAIRALWPKAVTARSCEMLGAMGQVLEMSVRYSQERRQFGQPLSGFQSIQHYLADMAIEIEAARVITHQAAWSISEELPSRKEAAVAKAWASDTFKHLATMAHQIHGGIGFTEEHDLYLYFRCSKAWELSFGDTNVHRAAVADEMEL